MVVDSTWKVKGLRGSKGDPLCVLELRCMVEQDGISKIGQKVLVIEYSGKPGKMEKCHPS